MLDRLPFPAPALRSIEDPTDGESDLLIVGVTEGGVREGGTHPSVLGRVDIDGRGWLDRCFSRGAFAGKLGETLLIANPATQGPAMVLLVGLGAGHGSRGDAFRAAATGIRRVTDRPRKRVDIALAESFPSSCHDAIVSGAMHGCEGQAIYQTDASIHVPETLAFVGIEDKAIRRGRTIGDAVNRTRRWVNEPASVIYPETFATEAREVAEEAGLEVEVWDEKRLEAEGCRAILAVGAGSTKPPRLVILRHRGGGDEPPLAIVGKGVTFDSGGLSIKPGDGMKDMKCDMAGAATVLGVMQAIAKLGIKKNVIGLCGLAENMISGESYKLGDVIETRSGTTVEILNTDAEGRVVLADVLDVAVQQQPCAIVDLATLTGACLVALGTEVAGLMTNDTELGRAVRGASDAEGEPVWDLPMFELYDELIKGKVADIKNVGEGRWGGAITAAKFLERFVAEVPWVHIDIAGPAFADSPKPHRDAGATGVMVRSLIRWVEG